MIATSQVKTHCANAGCVLVLRQQVGEVRSSPTYNVIYRSDDHMLQPFDGKVRFKASKANLIHLR